MVKIRRVAIVAILALMGPTWVKWGWSMVAVPNARADASAYVEDGVPHPAIGGRTDWSPEQWRALAPNADYTPMPEPQAGEWLATVPEVGQSVSGYMWLDHPGAAATEGTIYIRALGTLAPEIDMRAIRDHLRVYYGAKVELLDPMVIEGTGKITARRSSWREGEVQLLAEDLIALLEEDMPEDALIVAGLVGEDLYSAGMGFVYGLAMGRSNVSSTMRGSPAWRDLEPTDELKAEHLLSAMKTVTHEVGHSLGLDHCIYFRCVMNGVNNELEAAKASMHACPVCQAKITRATGVDLRARYEHLRSGYESLGLNEEASFMTLRLEHSGKR